MSGDTPAATRERRTTLVEDFMDKALKDHVLTSIHQSMRIFPKSEIKDQIIKAYWMRNPKSSHYCALIIFSPIGITIGGDIRIGNMAAINSVPGYGEDWFGGYLDEDYLCGKFDLDWTPRPSKSRRSEVMRASCGWLSAVQQKFNVLWQDMMVKKLAGRKP